jgi:hypothetical protein
VGRSIKKAKAEGGRAARREVPKSPLDSWGLDRVAVDLLWDYVFRDRDNDREEEAKAGMERSVSEHAAELAGPNPTPTEAMLARVAATNWFAVRMYDMICAGALGTETSPAGFERQWRRADRAHRRLLSTLKALATIRKLGAPTIQINVAEQQVNQVGAAMLVPEGDRPALGAESKSPAAIAGPRARGGRRGAGIPAGKERGSS